MVRFSWQVKSFKVLRNIGNSYESKVPPNERCFLWNWSFSYFECTVALNGLLQEDKAIGKAQNLGPKSIRKGLWHHAYAKPFVCKDFFLNIHMIVCHLSYLLSTKNMFDLSPWP